MGSQNNDELRQRYHCVLNSAGDMDKISRLMLLEGIPGDANALHTETFGRSPLRGLLWKALLGVGCVDTDEYDSLVLQGPSNDDSRVSEDDRRTFPKGMILLRRSPRIS